MRRGLGLRLSPEAERMIAGDVGIHDLLTNDEISLAEQRIRVLRGEFDEMHRLDAVDWCIAGAAGSLAQHWSTRSP